MTPDEAVELLTRAAAYDQRTIGRADAEAWSAALADIPLADAAPAVAAWYSRRRDRIMPADVRGYVTTEANAAWQRMDADERMQTTKVNTPHLVDDAEFGCLAWIRGWRQTQGEGPPPPYRLADAVGRSAVALSKAGMSRTDLARAMWEAGLNSVILPAPPAAEGSA